MESLGRDVLVSLGKSFRGRGGGADYEYTTCSVLSMLASTLGDVSELESVVRLCKRRESYAFYGKLDCQKPCHPHNPVLDYLKDHTMHGAE